MKYIISPIGSSIKKLHFFSLSFLSLCLLLSCSKNSTISGDKPGADNFGCGTTSVEKLVSNQGGKLVYVPAQSQWMVTFDLEGSVYVACQFCDNAKGGLAGIINAHSQGEVIPVTVTGKIVKRYEGQKALNQCTDGGYREIYLLQAENVKK